MIIRILTAAILIALVLAVLYLAPYPVFLLMIDLVLVLLLREFSSFMLHHGALLFPTTFPLILMLPWIAGYYPLGLAGFLLLCLLLTLVTSVFLVQTVQGVFAGVSGNLLALCYLGIPFAITAFYHPGCPTELVKTGRAAELILVLAAIWISDSAAYFTGRLIGKRKITPRISPNKTLEGFIAGVVVPPLALPLVGSLLLLERSPVFFFAAGTIVAAAGIVGDLFESILKRSAGIKDSSQLIPGHGGVLDRLDSFLFALPAYFLLTMIFEYPGS